jgi:hypothetical protein
VPAGAAARAALHCIELSVRCAVRHHSVARALCAAFRARPVGTRMPVAYCMPPVACGLLHAALQPILRNVAEPGRGRRACQSSPEHTLTISAILLRPREHCLRGAAPPHRRPCTLQRCFVARCNGALLRNASCRCGLAQARAALERVARRALRPRLRPVRPGRRTIICCNSRRPRRRNCRRSALVGSCRPLPCLSFRTGAAR